MSSDEDDEVRLYSALDHNQKRKAVVCFSSSDSEEDDDNIIISSPPKKRVPNGIREQPNVENQTTVANSNAVVIDDEEDIMPYDVAVELEIQKEVEKRLSQDKVLTQTRALMTKISKVKTQATNSNQAHLISCDSDSDSDVVEVLPTPTKKSGSTPNSAHLGAKLTLRIRANGDHIDDITIYSKEPFEKLYKSYCDLHRLPRSAVQLSLDGEGLNVKSTSEIMDLESGDLIEAKADFSQQTKDKIKRLIRLRLHVNGKRHEVFKMDSTMPLAKLQASFCKKHQILDPDDVELRIDGESARLNETTDYYGLMNGDEVQVLVRDTATTAVSSTSSLTPPDGIPLTLRYLSTNETELHYVLPSAQVDTLLQRLASSKSTDVQKISLRIDGEEMKPDKTFQFYDLEGGELIDVKVNRSHTVVICT